MPPANTEIQNLLNDIINMLEDRTRQNTTASVPLQPNDENDIVPNISVAPTLVPTAAPPPGLTATNSNEEENEGIVRCQCGCSSCEHLQKFIENNKDEYPIIKDIFNIEQNICPDCFAICLDVGLYCVYQLKRREYANIVKKAITYFKEYRKGVIEHYDNCRFCPAVGFYKKAQYCPSVPLKFLGSNDTYAVSAMLEELFPNEDIKTILVNPSYYLCKEIFIRLVDEIQRNRCPLKLDALGFCAAKMVDIVIPILTREQRLLQNISNQLFSEEEYVSPHKKMQNNEIKKRFAPIIYKKGDESNFCSICQDDIKDKDKVQFFPCCNKQFLHFDCFIKTLEQYGNACLFCKKEIK